MVAASLGDVAEVISGVGFPKDLQGSSDGDVPVFKVGDISNAIKSGTHFLLKSPNNLSKAAAHKLSKTLMPSGTIVFAKIGEGLKLNRRAVLSQPSLVDNNVMGLVPKAGVATSSYLYYFMQTVDLGTLSRATAVPSVRKSDVVELPIPLPPIAQQDEIVAELEKQFSRLDEAVANLQRVKANLKRYKASVLKDAVEGRLVPLEAELARREGRSFETGEQLLQRILEARRSQWRGRGKYREPTEPSEAVSFSLPEGWSLGSLDQLHLQIADVDHKMPKAVDIGVPYVSTKDFFSDEGINFTGAKRISVEDFEALCRKVRPENGDLLLSRYGTIGEVRLVTTDGPFQASYSVAIMKPVRGHIPVSFLATVLRSDVVISQIKRDVRATAQPDLGLAHIRQFIVPIPPIAEQKRIVAETDRCLSIVRGVEAEVDANLKRAQALRRSTLSRAFSVSQ